MFYECKKLQILVVLSMKIGSEYRKNKIVQSYNA
jgi:hypothetical protein